MYETLAESGVIYGETFRGLENIQACNYHAVADLRYPNTAAAMPYEYESDFMIHPATLDMCIQIVWPIFGAGRMGVKQLYLPSFIKDLSISCNIGHRKAGEVIRIHGSGDPMSASSKPVHLDLFATNPDHADDVLLDLKGLIMTPVYDKDVDSGKKVARELCYKVEWDTCLDSLKPEQFKMMFNSDAPHPDEKRKIQLAEQASFYYLENTLAQVPPEHYSSLDVHQQKFYAWMQSQVELGKERKLKLQTDEWLSSGAIDRKKFLAAFKKSSAVGELICSVGEKLPEILKREVEPAQIIQDDLLNRYYEERGSSSRGSSQAALYLKKLAHQNPQLSILEVGADQGGATQTLLEALGGDSAERVPRFGHYVYTDKSGNSFETAKSKFSAWGGLIDFRKFDTDKAPVDQGFEKGSFDIVIASNTLHTSRSLNQVMHNIRKLLKPDGKLLLIEETTQHLSQFVRAILPSWWQSEEQNRSDSPIINEATWDEALVNAGFSGVDFSVDDYPEAPEHQMTMMISTAISSAPYLGEEVAIITHNTSPTFPISTLASAIQTLTGKAPMITSL